MLSIRSAVRDDAALLKTLIHEFAEFERLPARITAEALVRDGFGSEPKFRALIADWDQHPAGYALFFSYYSSFRGLGLFLEDLYVRPQFRGKSVGKLLLAHVAAIARDSECFGVVFNVLDWNRPALDFYEKLGASFWNDWKVVCLESAALAALAKETSQC